MLLATVLATKRPCTEGETTPCKRTPPRMAAFSVARSYKCTKEPGHRTSGFIFDRGCLKFSD